jgi:hypothetical protein
MKLAYVEGSGHGMRGSGHGISGSGHHVCCSSHGISGREWSWHIWNGIIMAYLEGNGHDKNTLVCSNAKSEYFHGDTEENHGE